MAYISSKQPVMASLLDRLLDDEPATSHETIKSRQQLLNDLHLSVRRDLEHLLNTRQDSLTWPEQWSELVISLVSYGMPDFTRVQLIYENRQREFCQKIRTLILNFDPRFKNVEVALIIDKNNDDRILRLRIEGWLNAEPAPELVMFDSILEPGAPAFIFNDVK